jgi:HSP20 family molecular chaperone IbpA
MSFLTEWNPFKELEKMRAELDVPVQKVRNPIWFEQLRKEVHTPRIESYLRDGKLVTRIDLPGVDPRHIDTIVVGDMLVVRAKREDTKETKKCDFVRREVSYGSYARPMRLPEGIKAEDIKVTYRDGVLELTAPAPKKLVPKEVHIQVEGTQPKKVETETAAA